MAKKIDPLNRKNFSALCASITVSDLKAAVNFYTKALGFTKRAIMNGPDKKPLHAELTLRGSTLMLGPEGMGGRSAKSVGGSPVMLYLTTENVDKTVAKALKMGATLAQPVADQFWGDRVGWIVDPDGLTWMIATHIADLTQKQIDAAMKKMMAQYAGGAGA